MQFSVCAGEVGIAAGESSMYELWMVCASLKSSSLAVLSVLYPVKAEQHGSSGASFCPAVLTFTVLYIPLIFTYNVCIIFFKLLDQAFAPSH